MERVNVVIDEVKALRDGIVSRVIPIEDFNKQLNILCESYGTEYIASVWTALAFADLENKKEV